MNKFKLNSSKLLLVEGRDEVEFFEAFFKYLNISEFQIINAEGKDNFQNHILSLKAVEGFNKIKIIGIIRDADQSAENSFISVCNSLKNADLDIPIHKNTFTDGEIKTGVFIMPGNKEKGMLENLCLQSVEGSKEIDCIERFFDCIPEKPKNIAKSKVQAYLSTRKNFVHSLGLAAKKGYWDFENEKFNELRKFIESYQET